ncbi:phosphate ABC transporter permease PstA [Synechococcus sp. Nb3U1]|uniref:phosphate ABC transporter permease PstA n=1 Tax=Synechococcus sp. Nb3U1 TaxID=1914529 RepID=UPI001F3324F0|nr:phosphate ABC transporter permease PstA [Synechococcus sp. Nb3U1]MCF2970685.1 phosphate ABC transporter permease PstA [Synechococcus sp. Nb3U1]
MSNSAQFQSEDIDISRAAIAPIRNYSGKALTILSAIFVAIIIVPLAWVLWDVAKEGVHKLNWYTFTQTRYPAPGLEDGGFGHAIVGSLMVLSTGAALSFPFGILTAVYLSEFGRGTRLTYLVKFSCNVLTGVPAILCGLFAYAVVVKGSGFSAFSGGIALGILMLPIVIRSTEEALLLVSPDMRLASTGLGSTRFQTTMRIVLPAAAPAIVTGLLLALARAAGEAAPLLFTSFNNNFWSTNLFGPVATLPVMTYFFAIIPYEPQQELAWAGALVLLAIVLIASLVSRFLVLKTRT